MSNWAVLLTYGCLDYTKLCVNDLLEQDVPLSLYVIVNQPPEGDLETASWLRCLVGYQRGRIMIHEPQGNTGIAQGWNMGLRAVFAAGATEALVPGNDARLRPDTYRRLSAMEGGVVFSAYCESLEDMIADKRAGRHSPPQWDTTPDIGPVHLMRRPLFEAVGGYDEGFHPAYYEDVDFYRRARLLDVLPGFVASDVPSFHQDGGSRHWKRSPEAEAQHHKDFVRNRDRYIAKWGGLPPNETYTVPWNGQPQ